MSSADRLLGILSLFGERKTVWTVEGIAATLEVSNSTAYRYVRSLCDAGLLDPVHGDGYRLGPAIIEYDRLIRLSDPMLAAATPVLQRLQAECGRNTMTFLSRLYRETVMSLLEVSGENAPQISYERGRPMAMFRGATSKIILAYLPRRTLRRLFDRHGDEIRAGTEVGDWAAFLSLLKDLRRAGHCIARAEIDPGCLGVAAPVFDRDGAVLGSLSVVVAADTVSAADTVRLAGLTTVAAATLTGRIGQFEPVMAQPARNVA